MLFRKKISLLASLIVVSFLAAEGETLGGGLLSEARIMGVPQPFYDMAIAPNKGKSQIHALLKESYHRGSYREIGRSHAKFLLQAHPTFTADCMKLMHALVPAKSAIWRSDIQRVRELLRTFYPEALDEIDGFAEVAGFTPEDAIRYFTLYEGKTGTRGNIFGNCSVFAVGNRRSATGTPLVGRNFDWFTGYCDMSVVGSAPTGAYASVGTSFHHIGRVDGMNEHGLFIGVMMSVSIRKGGEGFLFPIIVRAVLDKAKNLDEAIAIIRRAPHSDGLNYLIADRSGKAAVIELIPGKPLTIRSIEDDPDDLVLSTNHFQNPGAARLNSTTIANSFERVRAMRRLLGKEKEKIGMDDVMRVLTTERPGGVYETDHEVGSATLFSGAYDLQKGIWRLRVGQYEAAYTVSDIKPGTREIVFESSSSWGWSGNKPNIFDVASFDGFLPVDLDTWYLQAGLAFYGSDLLLQPVADVSVHYKKGFNTERTYGPHADLAVAARASGSSCRVSFDFALNLVPILSFRVSPFYSFSYPGGTRDLFTVGPMRGSQSSGEGTFGVAVNPVLSLGGIITLENRLGFYFFKDPAFDDESMMTLRDSLVWSPKLLILIPYSRNFSWGLQTGANMRASLDPDRAGEKPAYNVYIGPVLAFPTIVDKLNLLIAANVWVKRGEERNWFFGTVGLQTQY